MDRGGSRNYKSYLKLAIREIVRFLVLVVPLAFSIWRCSKFPGAEIFASFPIICVVLAMAQLVAFALCNPTWKGCLAYFEEPLKWRLTIVVYIIASALPSFMLLLLGLTGFMKGQTSPRIDPLSLTVVQFTVAGLVGTVLLARINAKCSLQHLSYALVDDFLYAYDVIGFLDFQLDDNVKGQKAARLLVWATVLGLVSMFKYMLVSPISPSDDVIPRGDYKQLFKSAMFCHELPFLIFRVVLLAQGGLDATKIFFILKNLVFLSIFTVQWTAHCCGRDSQPHDDPEDGSDTHSSTVITQLKPPPCKINDID